MKLFQSLMIRPIELKNRIFAWDALVSSSGISAVMEGVVPRTLDAKGSGDRRSGKGFLEGSKGFWLIEICKEARPMWRERIANFSLVALKKRGGDPCDAWGQGHPKNRWRSGI